MHPGLSGALCLALVLAVLPLPLMAMKGGLAEALGKLGWEEIAFDNKAHNHFTDCGEGCIEVSTDASVSMIGREVSRNLRQSPVLSWDWKIEEPLAVSNLAAKGEDDRAVAIYVTFPYDPETAPFFEKLQRPLLELLRGRETPGRMLSYVWGGFGEPGDLVESPYFGGANAMVISRTEKDPVGRWLKERVNIVADHKRAFGFVPQKVAHILISADSDDTGTRNRAWVRHITFSAR